MFMISHAYLQKGNFAIIHVTHVFILERKATIENTEDQTEHKNYNPLTF